VYHLEDLIKDKITFINDKFSVQCKKPIDIFEIPKEKPKQYTAENDIYASLRERQKMELNAVFEKMAKNKTRTVRLRKPVPTFTKP
jgi:hypothetical protein